MKRIYNSDVRLQTEGMNLPEAFTFKFYTIDQNVNITKNEDDVDENGYINLDWNMLQLLGEGALSYVLTKHIPDESYPDGYYDTTVTRATNYYIVTTVQPIPPSESATTLEVIINLIEDFEGDMMDNLSAETYNRMLNDQELEDSISGLTGRVEVLEGRDFSGFATKSELENATQSVKDFATERDSIVLNSARQYADQLTNGMATQAWVNNQGYLREHQDLSNYLTLSDYNRDKQYMADKDWTQNYIAQQDFATKDYVQEVIEGGIPLDNYYTKEQVDDKIAAISTDTFATRDEMTQAIATASGATITWVVNQNYLTEHQSLADYYTKSETYNKTEVDDAIANVDVSEQLVNYATTAVTADLQVQINGKQDKGNYVSASTLNDYYTSAQTDNLIAGYIDGAVYVSSAKTINFYHGSTIVAQVDATEFIKDGMVTNVAIGTRAYINTPY